MRTRVPQGLAGTGCHTESVLRPPISLPLIWIIIGLIVAATHNFFDHVGTIGGILSAILAVLLWPLILLGVKITIAI